MKNLCDIPPVVIENVRTKPSSPNGIEVFPIMGMGSFLGYSTTQDLRDVILGGVISLGAYSTYKLAKSVVSYIKKPRRELDSIFDDY